MGEKCDCLNDCGDDRRVHQYLVEPCDGRMREAQREKARLQAEISLREDAARYRWFRAAYLPNGLGVYGAELDAAIDQAIRDEKESPND